MTSQYDTMKVIYEANEALYLLNEKNEADSLSGYILYEYGTVNWHLSDDKKAVELYQALIDMADTIQFPPLKFHGLFGIGQVYESQAMTDEALDLYLQCLEVSARLPNPYFNIMTLQQIGGIHRNEYRDSLAGVYFQGALNLYWEKEIENEQLLMRLLTSMALYKLDVSEYKEAIQYYRQSREISVRRGDNRTTYYIDMGMSYVFQQLYDGERRRAYLDSAVRYQEAVLDSKFAFSSAVNAMNSYQGLAHLEEKRGNFQKALAHWKSVLQWKDSTYTENAARDIREVREKYETEKKEQQILLQEAKLSQAATFRNALVIGSILLVAVIGLVARNARLKTRSLSEKESLLKEIHHRVKNNLQVISSLLNMQSRESTDPQMLDVIKEGQSRVKAMSLIHQKLYQTSNLSEIDFEEYSTQLIDQLAALYKKKGLEVTKNIEAKNIKLDIDTAIPLGLILNELISNSFKYAFEDLEKGEIQVSLERLSEEDLKLVVSDSGVGLPSDIDFASVKSLGLKLVNILTKQLKGSLDFFSEEGARFEIQFKDLRMSAS